MVELTNVEVPCGALHDPCLTPTIPRSVGKAAGSFTKSSRAFLRASPCAITKHRKKTTSPAPLVRTPTSRLTAEMAEVTLSTRERAKSIVKTAFGASPIARQRAKEQVFKERLSRCKTSWWDAAAVGISDGTFAVDRALKRTSCHNESSLLALAKGRIHAQLEVEAINEWRNAAVDSFLGASPKRKTPAVSISHSPASPGHYRRKYGSAALPPLQADAHLQRKLRVAQLKHAAEEREQQTRSMRMAVFHASCGAT